MNVLVSVMSCSCSGKVISTNCYIRFVLLYFYLDDRSVQISFACDKSNRYDVISIVYKHSDDVTAPPCVPLAGRQLPVGHFRFPVARSGVVSCPEMQSAIAEHRHGFLLVE